MKVSSTLRLFTVGVMTLSLIIANPAGALAAGNYYGNEIVWTKSDCTTGSWRIWKMGEGGGPQTILTQVPPAGFTDEHPVYNDTGTEIVFVRDSAIYKMDATLGEWGGLTLLASSYAHHPFVFGSKVYYVAKNPSGVRQIMRMNLSDGSSKEVVLSSGSSESGNKWHPTVAANGGKNYLVYVEGDEDVANDSKVNIYNLTDAIGPVTLADGASLPGGEEYNAPSMTPDGAAILLTHSRGLSGNWEIERRDLTGDPMNPVDGDITTILTTNPEVGKVEVTPYADYPASGEMDFVRGVGLDGEIFHKTGITSAAGAPTNITNDAAGVDVKVVEKSSCNPQPVPCPPTTGQHQQKPSTGSNLNLLSIVGFLTMMVGFTVLFWQQRRQSRILA